MKEARLKALNNCLKAIQNAHDTLEEVRDEEEEAYDNMPEGLQYSERGDMMQEAIDCLDETVDSLDDVLSYLEDAISSAEKPDVMEFDLGRNWRLEIASPIRHSGRALSAILKGITILSFSKTELQNSFSRMLLKKDTLPFKMQTE